MTRTLHLSHLLRDEILNRARADAPHECCGLLAGTGALVSKVIPLVNELRSATAYAAEVRGLFEAFRTIRNEGLELLAIYHSHPTTGAVPSRRDIAEWHYTDALMVIVSLQDEAAIRAWSIAEEIRECTLIG